MRSKVGTKAVIAHTVVWITSMVAPVVLMSPQGWTQQTSGGAKLSWSELPPLPDELGVAGPFAGIHHDALIVAGGANFPRPVWQNEKQWHDAIYVLTRNAVGDLVWGPGGKLPRKTAYGAAVSTSQGVVCIGGNDSQTTFDTVFLLAQDPQTRQVTATELPSLPAPRAFAAATLLGDRVFVMGGQSGPSLESATADLWSLDLSQRGDDSFGWEAHESLPGPTRALHVAATVQLTRQNRTARQQYECRATVQASRSSLIMVWSGLTILAFVIFHILHFTVRVDANLAEIAKESPHAMVIAGFQNWLVVLFYVIAMTLLCSHLAHGTASIFQTLGLRSAKTAGPIQILSNAYALVIWAGFISIPLAIAFGIVK